MIIEKNREGYWVIKDIIGDYWETRRYLYYTKKEAVQKFKKEFNL